jgi:malonate transporter and related proteins
MDGALGIVLPIFIVIGLGFAASAGRVLGERTADGLSDYVFVIAIPILLFRTLATAPLPDVQPWAYWLAYFAALGAVWITMAVTARRFFGVAGPERVIMGFSAGQSNTVFIGIPLILRAYGDAATLPIFMLLAVHLPLTMAVATLLVERGSETGAGQGAAGVWLGMARKLATHPIIIGIIAGALFRLSGLPMPDVVSSSLKIVADTAAPTALFALGMTLRRYGLSADPGPLAMTAVLKLAVQPALVFLLAFHVLAMPPVWAATAVLFAACPSGVNGYLLAQRYRIGVANASAAIALTTMLSALTLSFWIWALGAVR